MSKDQRRDQKYPNPSSEKSKSTKLVDDAHEPVNRRPDNPGADERSRKPPRNRGVEEQNSGKSKLTTSGHLQENSSGRTEEAPGPDTEDRSRYGKGL